MFSDKIKARLAGLALASAVFAVPGAASAGVVVKSSGPSASTYPVGRQVADSASITLRAGDKITVLVDGGTRVLQGPGTFRVGEGATRTRARFSNLTRRRASTRARTGAVRGAGDAPGAETAQMAPPNLWFVNLASSGTICLYDFERVRLWRPSTEAEQTYTITDQSTQTSLDVNFVGTETMRALDPAGMQLAEGRSYTITGPAPADGSEPASTVVSFATLDGTYRQEAELAQALIDKGCTGQLTQLANELESFAE